jgi:hypothetical protein
MVIGALSGWLVSFATKCGQARDNKGRFPGIVRFPGWFPRLHIYALA